MQVDPQDYELMMRGYPLRFIPVRDEAVENLRFPSMRGAFRDLEALLGRPPRQGEFEEACIAAWRGPFPRGLETPIRARLARAYPSFLRERHFGLLLAEACTRVGLQVQESEALDFAGIDYVVSDGVGQVGIAVRQGTARSRLYAQRRTRRYERVMPVVVAELQRDNRWACGRFWLYRAAWVQQLVDTEVAHRLTDRVTASDGSRSRE